MDSPAAVAYEQSLAFLVSQIGARTVQIFAELLAPLGVSARAYGVLSNLAAASTQSQQQLADALGMHRNNMVGLIDELEGRGWVHRHRNTADRRSFDIRLTDAGTGVVERVNELLPTLEGTVRGGLTGRQYETARGLLSSMARDLGLRPGVHPYLAGRR